MKQKKASAIVAGCLVLAGCAVGSDGSDIGQTPRPTVKLRHLESPTPSCERLDDLGIAASAERDQVLGRGSAETHCVSISGQEIAAIGTRSCKLVEPQAFVFQGCADWYECEGCLVELRQNLNGDFSLSGLSTSPTCADLRAKYVLYPGVACD